MKNLMLRALAVVLATATVMCSLRPVAGSDTEVVQIKPTAAVMTLASDVKSSGGGGGGGGGGAKDSAASAANDTASPCDRYLRSTEVEVRGPRNHKFVTSNGWADRQRPKPEINVYAHVEEVPTVQSPSAAAAATAAAYYQQQQRETYYRQSQQAQQPPTVRTSKRIIYYATLPDVIRPPQPGAGYAQPGAGYAQPGAGYTQPGAGYNQPGAGYAQPGTGYPPAAVDPYALGPGPFSADFRQLDRNAPPDSLQHNRLAPYENAYNRRGSAGDGGGAVTSVTSKSSAVFNSRYDEPAEFREPVFRPNEFTSSKFASWAEPFYKSWTSASWDKDSPSSWDKDSPQSYGSRIGDAPSFSWDRDPPLLSRWDNHGGSVWDRSGSASPWENRGSSWDNKELVEVPLQQRKPNRDGGSGGIRPSGRENDFEPEVAVVHSGVIDVRGDRRQDGSPAPPPPARFAIIDVDPKPFQQPQMLQPPAMMRQEERVSPMMVQQQQNKMQQRYDGPQQQKPIRYETYMPIQPIQPPGHQQHLQLPPSSMRNEKQYRPPQSSSSSSSTRDGRNQQPKGYYESVKNTHEFMTSWTEVSEHGDEDVKPTHSIDIASAGNSSMRQNGTRIAPNAINVTKLPK